MIVKVSKIFGIIFYKAITYFLLFLFFFCAALFLFFVFLQSNPRIAERFIKSSVKNVMHFNNIQQNKIDVNVKNGNIKIKIAEVTKDKGDLQIKANNINLSFAFYEILKGKLYNVSIENLWLKIDTTKKFAGNGKISKYYKFLPKLKVSVANLFVDFDNRIVHLEKSSLTLNQRGYILWLETESKKDHYKINIAISTTKVKIFFHNVAKQIVDLYTENKFHQLQNIIFKSITGHVEFEMKNISNIEYNLIFNDLYIAKNKFIESDVYFPNETTVFGYKKNDIIRIIANNVTTSDNSKLSADITHSLSSTKINVNASNFSVKQLKSFVPMQLIKNTQQANLTKYLTSALTGNGLVKNAKIAILLDKTKQNDFSISVDFENIDFEYSKHFAPILNGYGNVEANANKTIINIKKGISIENNIKDSKVEINGHKVDIKLNLEGTPTSIANVFFPKKKLNITNYVNANVFADGNISIDLSCKDVFFCTTFNADAKITNLQTIINDKQNNSSQNAFLNVKKIKGDEIKSKITFKTFKNKYFNAYKMDFNTKIQKNEIIFSSKIFDDKFQVLANIDKVVFNTKQKFDLSSFYISKINFAQNDFSIEYKLDKVNSINVYGNRLHIPIITEIFKTFQSKNNNQTKFFNTKNFNINLDLQRVQFYNNISSILMAKIETQNTNLVKAFIESNIVQMKILPTTNTVGESYITIKDLPKFINALYPNVEQKISQGFILLNGKHENNAINWSGTIENLKYNENKFKLSPKKIDINAKFENHTITFSNIKIQDFSHTVFITGTIFTNNFTTKTKIFYTPSAIEFLNEIPILKNALNLTTFGATKHGIISFEIDLNGSLLNPEMSIQKTSSTAKSFFKVGNILLMAKFLPIILL